MTDEKVKHELPKALVLSNSRGLSASEDCVAITVPVTHPVGSDVYPLARKIR